jgi:hypothetical protein
MKTNTMARRMMKARSVVLVLAIAGLAVIDLGLYESMAGRIGQTTGAQSDVPQAPNVSISDLMGTFR